MGVSEGRGVSVTIYPIIISFNVNTVNKYAMTTLSKTGRFVYIK